MPKYLDQSIGETSTAWFKNAAYNHQRKIEISEQQDKILQKTQENCKNKTLFENEANRGKKRLLENEVQREARLKKMREYNQNKKLSENEAQREARLKKSREYVRNKLFYESEVERERRLAVLRANEHRRRASETPEQREERLRKMREAAKARGGRKLKVEDREKTASNAAEIKVELKDIAIPFCKAEIRDLNQEILSIQQNIHSNSSEFNSEEQEVVRVKTEVKDEAQWIGPECDFHNIQTTVES